MKTATLHHGPFTLRNLSAEAFTGVSIDSRNIPAGHIFCALKGEHTDGHRFVSQALNKGAVAALVNREYARHAPQDEALIIVEDTYQGLIDMAALYAKQLHLPVLGITGSAGKTSTRRLISHILRQNMMVAETPRNFNNHIGVPVTVLGMTGKEDIAVIEIGTSAIGEIRELCKILAPDLGLITSIAHAHIGGFGSVDNVQIAKYELFDAVKDDGILFVNRDDPRVAAYPRDKRKRVTYGLSNKADIKLSIENIDNKGRYILSNGKQTIRLQNSGKGAAMNAVAAYAVALTLGMQVPEIIAGLESYEPVAGRGKIEIWKGVTLIDDTYNANPLSLRNAIEALEAMRSERHKVVVFGDMLEMGAEARSSHEDAGRLIAGSGVSHLFCYGNDSRYTVKTAKMAGMAFCEHYTSKKELTEDLYSVLKPGDTVLFKGSRGVAIEEIISLIKDM